MPTQPPKPTSRGSASHDDEYSALLSELRVLLPGVEILFAFLLGAAFSERFETLGGVKWVYFTALISAAMSSVLLLTPGVYHRVRWREADKEELLRRANTLTLLGTVALVIAMSAGIYLAAWVTFGSAGAAIAAAGGGMFTITLWYGVPLFDRIRDRYPDREGSRKRRPKAA